MIDFLSIFNGFGTPFSSQVGPCWRQVGHLGASWGSFWRSWAPSWLQGAPQAPPRASRPPQTSISTDLGTIFGRIWGPQDAQVAAKMASWTSIWTPQGCRITKKSTYKKISFDPTNTRGRRQRRQPLDKILRMRYKISLGYCCYSITCMTKGNYISIDRFRDKYSSKSSKSSDRKNKNPLTASYTEIFNRWKNGMGSETNSKMSTVD